MNSIHQKNMNGLLLVYDKYDPINRQRIPMIDKICFEHNNCIGRTIFAKTTPLTLEQVRKQSSELRFIANNCVRSRAYVIVGLSEYKSPMPEGLFLPYLDNIYKELDFCGYDVCFVQLLFTGEGSKAINKIWQQRYKETFSGFPYEKLKVVIDYKSDIFTLPKKSYINLWATISEDYKEWYDYV